MNKSVVNYIQLLLKQLCLCVHGMCHRFGDVQTRFYQDLRVRRAWDNDTIWSKLLGHSVICDSTPQGNSNK